MFKTYHLYTQKRIQFPMIPAFLRFLVKSTIGELWWRKTQMCIIIHTFFIAFGNVWFRWTKIRWNVVFHPFKNDLGFVLLMLSNHFLMVAAKSVKNLVFNPFKKKSRGFVAPVFVTWFHRWRYCLCFLRAAHSARDWGQPRESRESWCYLVVQIQHVVVDPMNLQPGSCMVCPNFCET